MISPIATPATAYGKKLFSRAVRKVPLYGVMMHTTGTSPLDWSSSKTADDVLARAVNYYSTTGGPHYVIGWDGTAVAIVADEEMRGAHAAIQPADQTLYYNNTWRDHVSQQGVALWENLWPGKRSPVDLLPNGNLDNINDYWIGIEHIPITYDGQTNYAQPAYPGSRFTQAQYDTSKKLADDIAQRHGFPSDWKSTPRLLGHSDINPIERDTANSPLWDPGYATGQFNMDFIKGDSSPRIVFALIATVIGIGAAWLFSHPRLA